MVKTVSKNNSYTYDQIQIIEYLVQGLTAVEISKKTGIPQYKISKQLKQWREEGLIKEARRDPLCNKAKIYNVDQKLRKIIEPSYIESRKKSFFEIHKLRFKAKFVEKNGEIATDISRFAKAQFKFIKTWEPHAKDIKYVFEKTGIYGRYKIICHRTSLEVIQVDKPIIEGKDIQEKESKLSIELAAAANRFIEEQRWCGCYIRLGELTRVGKYDIAAKSGKAQEIVDNGENTRHISEDMWIDNSNNEGELEGNNKNKMTELDEILQYTWGMKQNNTVEKVNHIYSTQGDIGIIKQTILGLPLQLTDINNSVMATCQSGMTRDQQFGQMTCILADLIKTVAQLGDKTTKHDDILIAVSRNNEQIAKNNEQLVKLLMEKT